MKQTGRKTTRWTLSPMIMALCATGATGAAAQTLDRTVLPIPEPKRPLYNGDGVCRR